MTTNGECTLCSAAEIFHEIFAHGVLSDVEAIKDDGDESHIIGIIAMLDQEIAQLEKRRLELLVAVGVYRNTKQLPVKEQKAMRRI